MPVIAPEKESNVSHQFAVEFDPPPDHLDGTLYGPFGSREAATGWASLNPGSFSYCVVPLREPQEPPLDGPQGCTACDGEGYYVIENVVTGRHAHRRCDECAEGA